MHRIYTKVISSVVNVYYWALDYLYISVQQIAGLFIRYDTRRYQRLDSQWPPVILLPGIYEKWQFMRPIAELLTSHGYSVHVVESLGYNTGSIEDMARRVEEYVKLSDIRDYHIIAHSKGGLIAKYILQSHKASVLSVITINTPFAGSRYAGLFPLSSIRSFMPNSATLIGLAKDRLSNHKITSIYGLFDPHIPGGSRLDGVTNVQLRTRGHFRVVSDKSMHQAILDSLAKHDRHHV